MDNFTQNVPKMASCIGNPFSPSTLKMILDEPKASKKALLEEIIVPSTLRYARHQLLTIAYNKQHTP